MKNSKFNRQLLNKYVAGEASAKELEAFFQLLREDNLKDELSEGMDQSWQELMNQRELPQMKIIGKRYIDFRWIAVAASLMLIFATYYFYTSYWINTPSTVVRPGTNTAIMTLANGKQVELSSAHAGVVMTAQGLSYEDGSLLDAAASTVKGEMLGIATPRGGTYQLRLADGSLVYLNASSSVRFSSDFQDKDEREVFLSGEAYFEVAKNPNKPFLVHSTGQVVKVLGTRFNVSAYGDDELQTTTLVEGSVSLNGLMMQPGQEVTQKNGSLNVRKVDVRAAMDWKNGEFRCSKEPLVSLMKKISRWYNVNIVFKQEVLKQKTFSGSLSRDLGIEELLKALNYAGIKTDLKDGTIYITN